MTEAAETHEEEKTHKGPPLPFALKAVAFFLAADGLFKLSAVIFGVVPGPEIFGYYQSFYYYGLVAIVDFSLAVQILGRAHYAWIWGVAFFMMQAAVMLTYFIFASPLAWLGPGYLGRLQVVLTIMLYLIIARYMVNGTVRNVLSPQVEKTE
jgi:hypothetical protein